jgi:hypothetical protein
MVRVFRLANFILASTVVLLSGCYLEPDKIEGTYFESISGKQYSLILSNGKFSQILINGSDTFVNSGDYSLSDLVSLSGWKEREELANTTKGGCIGCELKYIDGKLFFYTDPDDAPVEVFIKQ